MEETVPTRWDRFIKAIKDLGEVAKFIALLLAILGFILVFFPSMRRSGEIWVQPTNWYWIGAVDKGSFVSNGNYHSSLWQEAPLRINELVRVNGSVMVTKTSDLHIGHAIPGAGGIAQASYPAGVCLYVHQGQLRRHRGDVPWQLWVKANVVTC